MYGMHSLTPAVCTIHLGVPVVPEENMMNNGWLNGSCSNCSSALECDLMKSDKNTLQYDKE